MLRHPTFSSSLSVNSCLWHPASLSPWPSPWWPSLHSTSTELPISCWQHSPLLPCVVFSDGIWLVSVHISTITSLSLNYSFTHWSWLRLICPGKTSSVQLPWSRAIDIHSLGNCLLNVSTKSSMAITLCFTMRGCNGLGTFGANMALKDWPETKFALLCISIALPSRSKNSTTSEATDTRDSQQGVTVKKCSFCFGCF